MVIVCPRCQKSRVEVSPGRYRCSDCGAIFEVPEQMGAAPPDGRPVWERSLDWLDRQDALAFFVVLYLARWPIIIPVGWFQQLFAVYVLGGSSELEPLKANPGVMFVNMVILAPLLWIFIECTVPYWVRNLLSPERPQRPWGFICASALIMALASLPYAFPCGFVTGAFLAYCYGHFARHNQWVGFLGATTYLAAINVIGWTVLCLF